MKKKTPLFLAVSILIGLLTLFISTKFAFGDLQLHEAPKTKMLVIGKDTISLSSKVYAVPRYTTENNIEKQYYLNSFPGVLNWTVFHGVGLSLGAASIIFLVFLMKNLKNRFEIRFTSKESLLAILPIALAIVSVYLATVLISSKETVSLVSGADIMDHFNIIFSNPHTIVNKFISAYLVIGLVALIGITMVNISISKLHMMDSNKKEELKKGFKTIKDSLNIFALFSGLLLGVSIIGTRLQRDMIAEHFEKGKELIHIIYPDTFIYSYGLTFTLILALFFIPSLVYLNYSKKRMIVLEKEDKVVSTSWWHIGKESIEDAKLIFSIVLPLITSVVQNSI